MAIRIEYGDVSGYAQLGVLAGQATAAREEAQRQAASDRQVMQIQAQRASQERAFTQQTEMAEFDAFIDTQRKQASEAWELEKMELRSRHDFDMQEAKREMDFQSQIQREQRQQQEQDTKLKALSDKAPVEMGGDGFLSAEQYQDAVIKIESGYRVPRRTGQAVNPLAEFLKETPRIGADFTVPPEAVTAENRAAFEKVQAARQAAEQPLEAKETETTVIVNFLKSAMGKLSSASQTSLRKIIDEGNPAKIRTAFNRIKGEVAPKTLAAERGTVSPLQSSLGMLSEVFKGPIGWPKRSQ